MAISKYYDEEAALHTQSKTAGEKNAKVFLIGDSIRMGYCDMVKEQLSDIAEVIYPEDNCRYTQYTYVNLSSWKNLFSYPEEVKVIYWNNGHWDIAHWDGEEESLNSIEEYTKMLFRIQRRLKIYFPKARIVFSTTMPMNPNGQNSFNPRTTKEIGEYNEAAIAIFENTDILIDDVFDKFKTLTADYFADYCHLTVEGNKLLSAHISDYIRNILNKA